MRPLYSFLTFILFVVLFTPSCKKNAATPKSASKILDSLDSGVTLVLPLIDNREIEISTRRKDELLKRLAEG